MPTRALTNLFVERVKPPPKGRVEYFDASFPGLALRVTQSGAKSWCAFYRFRGRLRRFTIGKYPAIKPDQARGEARAALDQVRRGVDLLRRSERAAMSGHPKPKRSPPCFAIILRRHHKQNSRESTFLGGEAQS